MKPPRMLSRSLIATLPLAALIDGCSLFKNANETMKSANETMKNISKMTQSIEKEAGSKKAQPEATHEAPLLDAKVTALRVQAALRKEGAEFDHVSVDATKEQVIMTGTVASDKARERAAEIARGVDRKVKIKNELRVSR